MLAGGAGEDGGERVVQHDDVVRLDAPAEPGLAGVDRLGIELRFLLAEPGAARSRARKQRREPLRETFETVVGREVECSRADVRLAGAVEHRLQGPGPYMACW